MKQSSSPILYTIVLCFAAHYLLFYPTSKTLIYCMEDNLCSFKFICEQGKGVK